MAGQDSVYQLRIDLKGAKPPIWRRILVRPDITLRRLHMILQALMGWNGWHLHQFEKNGTRYSTPELEEPMYDLEYAIDELMQEPDMDPETAEAIARKLEEPLLRDESKFRLQDLLKYEDDTLTYLYDFGADWEHIIKLEKILPAEAGVTYPVCVKGRRATPPEDTGGIWGYKNKLHILKNPSHPDYEWVVHLIPPDYDPEHFDLDEVNDRLANLDRYEVRELKAQAMRMAPLMEEEPPIQLTPFFSSEPDDEDVDIDDMRETLLSMLRDLVGEVQEVLNGYRLSFPSDPVIWMLCANLVVLEYTLDTSLAFGLEIEANEGPIWLRVTGKNAKPFVKSAFDL